jgi:hypothetical protein
MGELFGADCFRGPKAADKSLSVGTLSTEGAVEAVVNKMNTQIDDLPDLERCGEAM